MKSEMVDYETTIRSIKEIQSFYHNAINKLRDIHLYLSEYEAITTKQLDAVLDALSQTYSSNYCLGNVTIQAKKINQDKLVNPSFLLRSLSNIPVLEVYFLGTFRIHSRHDIVEKWHSNKAKSLLQYLVCQHRRPVTKEVLQEALWPGLDPIHTGNNLKATVRTLRNILSQLDSSFSDVNWISYNQGSYSMNSEAHIWTDFKQFEYHWIQGCQLEQAEEQINAVKEFRAAEALYRGDYLESEPYEDWAILRRESLKDSYLMLLGKLSDYCIATRDYNGAIGYCQKIISRDCCREDAYRRMMICYNRLGNRNRALEWYKICEKTIDSELSLPPDRETQAIYQQLINDKLI
ncbi:BTAD domain-containing putative transcriptional regulator [Chloroflexota bacterium]